MSKCGWCRYDFIEFIRNGGRRPQAHPDPLTRQGSMELVSEASDPGQTHQQPPTPQDITPAPLWHDSQAASQHAATDPHRKASDPQQHQDLLASHKLAPLQTRVCHVLRLSTLWAAVAVVVAHFV